jgi:hypothetical protein
MRKKEANNIVGNVEDENNGFFITGINTND